MKKNLHTKKISISPKVRKELIQKFASRQTVHIALNYQSHSDLAKKIRKYAKERTLEEANKIPTNV